MQPIQRAASFVATRKADNDAFEASLASDQPVRRAGYREILLCTPEAVNMERAREGLPLLLHHNKAQIAGRVYGIRADGRRVRGAITFFTNAAGREGRAMVEGGHRELSVTYTVDEETYDDKGNHVVTRWTLLEVSVVAIPADSAVGVGRSFQEMSDHQTTHHSGGDADEAARMSRSQRRAAERDDNAERERVKTISRLYREYKDWVSPEEMSDAIERGCSVERFNSLILDNLKSGATDATTTAGAIGGAPAFVREVGDPLDGLARGFSIGRAIQAEIDPAGYLRKAGREKEISQELSRSMGISTSGVLVPFGAFLTPRNQRDMTSTGFGGNTIQTTVAATMWMDALRQRSLAVGLGAQVLTGLTGPIQLPRKSAVSQVGWVGEIGNASETQPATTNSQLTPHRVGNYVEMSRQLMLTSAIAVENMVRMDLQDSCMDELDRVFFVGSGTGDEPAGIAKSAGVGAVVGGTNGADLAWSHILDLERVVDDANALTRPESCGYVINGRTRSYLKRTPKVAGDGEGLIMGSERIDPQGFGVLNGYRCGVSAKIPSNLTKGSGTNLSMLLFGDFSAAVMGIFGGGVEIIVDPYSLATTAQVRVTANLFCDVACRQPGSFVVMEDANLPAPA